MSQAGPEQFAGFRAAAVASNAGGTGTLVRSQEAGRRHFATFQALERKRCAHKSERLGEEGLRPL